jgi:hypothetical protein
MGSCVLLTVTLTQLMVLGASPVELSGHEGGAAGTLGSWLLLLSFGVLYVATLIAALALLKRWYWARPAFICFMAVGIVLNLAKLGIGVCRPAPEQAMEGPPPYLLILRLASMTDVLLPIGTILLFGWIIVRLRSETVRAEFNGSGE